MKKKKEKVIAYLLALMAGSLGAHKFYLGKTFQGVLRIIPALVMMMCPILAGITASEIWIIGMFIAMAVLLGVTVYDLVKLGDEVDEYNEGIEPEIPSQKETIRPAATPKTDNRFVNTGGDTLKIQLNRASSLLQLGIVSPTEFGILNQNIASGQFVLSQNVYHDVVNLNNMKERQAIDGFMYDMQKSQILGLKYLDKE